MSIPVPGQPVRGSKSGAPVMALLDLLGRRWAMGVLWILAENGPCGFAELQVRCESISPGILSARLKDLRAALLVERSEAGYCVSELGRELHEQLRPLGLWARQKWARALLVELRN
ncbi:MAG: helix-turn-helix domain-containing protein [Gammaproteobacteria bacterium]|jgi:DNA-binding HxlR family transcriptional regulator